MMQSGYNSVNEQKIIAVFLKEDCEDEKNQLTMSQRNIMLMKIIAEINKKEDECYV